MGHFGGISSRASSLPSGEGGAESERGSVFTEVDIEMDELKVIQRMVEAEETKEKLQRVFGFYTFTKLVPGRAAVDWQNKYQKLQTSIFGMYAITFAVFSP